MLKYYLYYFFINKIILKRKKVLENVFNIEYNIFLSTKSGY